MWSALCVFSYDSPLVAEEYGFRMDRQICTLCNGVISIYSMDGDKKQVCVFIFLWVQAMH